jgi:hypothetical protein
LTNAGYSGSALSRVVRADGASFVLKRVSIERDWIMRVTDDVGAREIALSGLVRVSSHLRTPNVGAAREGDGFALLMRDITPDLLPERISQRQLDLVLRRIAELHALPPPDDVPWCDLPRRLLLLTPKTMAIASAYRAAVAADVIRGWQAFGRLATPAAVRIVQSLHNDVAPLVRALRLLPDAWLHGDLKLDNIGLANDGSMWLIDWAMTLVAPPAVDLGWFLAINSRRLPVDLDTVLAGYAEAAAIDAAERDRHDALSILCGLVLRGWRKALDADEGEPEELRWWCDRATAAARWLDA